VNDLGAVRLGDGDSSVEAVRRRQQVAVGSCHEVIADNAVDVVLETDTGVGVIRVGTTGPARGEAESDTACAVDDDVLFDQGVTAALPEVDAVLGQAGVAPEAFDAVAADHPALSLVDVDAPGVASALIRIDMGAADVGELDRTALDGAVVDVAVNDRVDLDRLLARVNDAQVMDEDSTDRIAGGTADVDRVVEGTHQGEIGDRHI